MKSHNKITLIVLVVLMLLFTLVSASVAAEEVRIGLPGEGTALEVGKTLNLLTPGLLTLSKEDVHLVFSSSNPAIASVDEKGIVRALKEGFTEINIDVSEPGYMGSVCFGVIVEPSNGAVETVPAQPTDQGTNTIIVRVDGESLSLEQPPVLINGRTLVPLRGIFEALGAQVSWESDSNTVKALKGDNTVSLKIGAESAMVNDRAVELDQPSQIINSRTLVPLRFVSEALGAAVSWDQKTKTVLINTNR